MKSLKPTSPTVGSRILVNDYYGTVRYVGPLHIDETGNTWLGIDWDDPSRGRHDGSVGGRRYFATSHPTAGSFMKPNPAIHFGIDVFDALAQHYQADVNVTPGEDEIDSFRRQSKASLYEVVGFDKFHERQKKLSNLSLIELSRKCISCGTLPGDQLPRLTDLILTGNLFSAWQQVHDCIKDLPKLETLDLNNNRLAVDGDLPSFEKIRTLRVSSCGMGWPELMQIGLMFPNLRDLSCCKNHITPSAPELEEFHNRFSQLEMLEVSENPFDSPEAFSALGGLKQLRSLSASCVGLKELVIAEGDFPALEVLQIHGNPLESCRSIDQLRKIKSLRSFRISEEGENVDLSPRYRAIVIAKLPQIVKLNGSEISRSDRRDAVLDFLRIFALEWHSAKSDVRKREVFLEEHSNYLDLVKAEGEPNDPMAMTTLANEFLEVTIVSPKHPISNPLKRKLPGDMTVGKFKGSVARTLGRPAVHIKWSLCPVEHVKPTLDVRKTYRELDCDDKEISLCFNPGDVVVVNW